MAIGVFYCSGELLGIEIPRMIFEVLTGGRIYFWQEINDDGLYCASVTGSRNPHFDDLKKSFPEMEKASIVNEVLYLSPQIRERLGKNFVIVAASKQINLWPQSDWEIAKHRLTPEAIASPLDELGL